MKQTRVLYFSGWEDKEYNFPTTFWIWGAKRLSKSEADIEAPKFEEYMKKTYGPGLLQIVKENRAWRKGYKG
jgi:hypothetical protein